MIYKYLDAIKNNNTKQQKISIIKECFKSPQFRKLFIYAYEPKYVYGIKNIKTERHGKRLVKANDLKMFFKMLDYQIKYRYNNKAIINKFKSFLELFDKREQEYLKKVLQKDLEIGIASKTLLEVEPGIISDFSLQLAYEFDKDRLSEIAYVEPKFDGLRCLYNPEYKTLFTRNGKEIKGYKHIKAILNALHTNYCIDGEIVSDTFDSTMSAVTSSINTKSKKVAFMCFDIFPQEYYYGNKKYFDMPLKDRKELLKRLLKKENNYVKYVNHGIVKSYAEIEETYHTFLNNNYEGIMIKNPKAYYEFKRSYNYMKIKPVKSMDMEVIAIYEGKGRLKGRAGAVKAKSMDGKYHCKVGITTDELSNFLWKHRNKLFTIEVYYDAITKDNSLRFPRIKCIRIDK